MLSNERFKRCNGPQFSWLVNLGRTARLPSTQLTLTTDYELLVLFSYRTVLIRDRIMERRPGSAWDRPIDVAHHRLRHKLQDDAPKRLRYFKTMWGTGHRVLPTLKRVPTERSGG